MTAFRTWDIGRLRMSVGYGQQKRGRHYSPVEVGEWVEQQRERGASLADCARTLNLNGTGHVGRFPSLLNLPDDVRHLVDWGAPRGGIGFSAAVELTKINSATDQMAVANAALKHGLTSREIRQIKQLRNRSDQPIENAIEHGLRMRPEIIRRHVFVGSVVSKVVREYIANWDQARRDALLRHGIKRVGLKAASGRLGRRTFTLVGGDDFGASMQEIGVDDLERNLLRVMEDEVLRERTES